MLTFKTPKKEGKENMQTMSIPNSNHVETHDSFWNHAGELFPFLLALVAVADAVYILIQY